MKKLKPLKLFESIAESAKRLILDYDLQDEEAKKLANIVDEANKTREQYTDRKLKTFNRTKIDTVYKN